MNPFQNILVCPECGKFAKKQRRWALKRWTRKSSNDWVYVCPGYPACDTYVGCHPRTDLPLGTMAGSDLRLARRKAHKAFD